jgi:hypothetical protein
MLNRIKIRRGKGKRSICGKVHALDKTVWWILSCFITAIWILRSKTARFRYYISREPARSPIKVQININEKKPVYFVPKIGNTGHK